MAATKSKTPYAILGLLSWQPMSGYDIKKLVDMGLQHFWSESYGQLYPTLDKLVANGLATRSEETSAGGRRRRVYSITAAGRRTFTDWLREPTDVTRVRSEPQLKFFLSGRLAEEEGIRLVEEYRQQLRESQREYAASEKVLRQAVRQDTLPNELAGLTGPGDANQPLVLLLSLRHGLLTTEARLAWCEEALRALRSRKRRRKTN
jgi:DNA-binding PadR family transcriptional regulator